MRKGLMLILLLAALAVPALCACAEEAAPAGTEAEEAEWTVMFYFCGSDLESKYGFASGNLEEIAQVSYPDTMIPAYLLFRGQKIDTAHIPYPPKVNVLIETGGTTRWHDDNLSIDIRTDVLQRWRYNCESFYKDFSGEKTGFELLENVPLASMARPETLADFIQWGAKTHPAKKYALVLWDHGGGAKTGMFVDELFGGDIMYLYELRQALRDGGVQLEAMLIDACLMANVETAWSVRDYTHWMIASEEMVPGRGTAVGDWLRELYTHPECGGEQLGRSICDTTEIKYSAGGNELAETTLTWSVIDLTKIDPVLKNATVFFRLMGAAFRDYPEMAIHYAQLIREAEEYGDGRQDMRDIGGLFCHRSAVQYIDRDVRNNALDALTDAVRYVVRGQGNSAARGLSFCYPVESDPAELDIYAKNILNPAYLAFLDAVSEWNAPDWVYETEERLPAVDSVEKLQVKVWKRMTEDGLPAVSTADVFNNLSGVYYRLYYLDPETGQTVCLGRTDCEGIYHEDWEYLMYANEPWIWPMINNVPCTMEYLKLNETAEARETLYSIPIQITSGTYRLRCERKDYYNESKKRTYKVFGVWENYDRSSMMAARSVTSLAEYAGQSFRLLWTADHPESRREEYIPAPSGGQLYRALNIEEKPLPAGTYYLQYEVDDMFLRPYILERIEMQWDGEHASFPESASWEGTVIPKWSGGGE